MSKVLQPVPAEGLSFVGFELPPEQQPLLQETAAHQLTLTNASLTVVGAISADSFSVNGSPVVSSPWVIEAGGINYTGGNVGIGTTTPAATLDVQGTLKIGNWVISEGSSGNLNFAKNGQVLASIDSSGRLLSQGAAVIRNQDPIRISQPSNQAFLNGTSAHGDGDHPTNFAQWTYWRTAPLDGDSDLVIGLIGG